MHHEIIKDNGRWKIINQYLISVYLVVLIVRLIVFVTVHILGNAKLQTHTCLKNIFTEGNAGIQ